MKKHVKGLALVCMLFIANGLYAQSGQFLTLWGGPQLVRMPNNEDYYATLNSYAITQEETFRSGYGFDYINNFQNTFGWQTGLTYSREGQTYSAQDSLGKEKVFSSGIYMNYLKLPFAFRFNSQYEEGDRINLSLYIGIEFSYLLNVEKVWSSPADTIPDKYRNFDFTKLYNRFNFGMVAGAQLNWHIKGNFWSYVGMRYDRSFTDIENTNYQFPQDYPSSWFFPVSTLKINKPAQLDIAEREATLPGVVSLHVGIMLQIARGNPPVPIEDNDQPAKIDENEQ